MANAYRGKVMTALGPIEPERLGAVMMHEHCYADLIATEEGETPPQYVELLRAWCAPWLKRLHDYGCHAFVDATPMPMRAHPSVYKELAGGAEFYLILSTGFYREAAASDRGMYPGTDVPHAWLDRRVSQLDEVALADIMVGELEEGIHGSDLRPGIIKLASTLAETTLGEQKAFRAGAQAQQRTGLSITTHANGYGVAKAQLDILEAAGADPPRVILGHTARDIVETPWVVRGLMDRGATFLPTNLRMDGDPRFMQRLANEINRLFDDGYGDRLVLGLDWAFSNDNSNAVLIGCSFMPPPPYVYMFEYTLPRLREMGLREDAIQCMLVDNPARLLPIV